MLLNVAESFLQLSLSLCSDSIHDILSIRTSSPLSTPSFPIYLSFLFQVHHVSGETIFIDSRHGVNSLGSLIVTSPQSDESLSFDLSSVRALGPLHSDSPGTAEYPISLPPFPLAISGCQQPPICHGWQGLNSHVSVAVTFNFR